MDLDNVRKFIKKNYQNYWRMIRGFCIIHGKDPKHIFIKGLNEKKSCK